MFKCHICGSTESQPEKVNELFQIGGKIFLVENIPAQVCCRCGEVTFSRETTEKIRQIVHGQGKPIKSVSVDVFAY